MEMGRDCPMPAHAEAAAMRAIALLLLLVVAGIAPAADVPAKEPATDTTEQATTAEVWVTRTGNRYHRATCRYAKIPSTRKDAIKRGLTPCQVCNP